MTKILIITCAIAALFVGAFFLLRSSEDVGSNIYKDKETQREGDAGNEVPAIKENAIFAVIKTEKGDIELALYPKVAPNTVANFVKLAKEGFYNGIKFHRVIPSFMIQTGDPLSRTGGPGVGSGGPGYTFKDEINPKSLGLSDEEISMLEAQEYRYNYDIESLSVDVGAIAMANSGPDTNGSQFFIVTYSPQPHLNGKHTVFGEVIEGIEIVRAIEQGDVINTIQIGGR